MERNQEGLVADKDIMDAVIKKACQGCEKDGGRPFAAAVVKDGRLISLESNSVVSTTDPTAHAEVCAIRSACMALGDIDLHGCTLYTSCFPCPMCLGAIYWAHIGTVYYAADSNDAASADFDDAYIYQQIVLLLDGTDVKFCRMAEEEASQPFEVWKRVSASK